MKKQPVTVDASGFTELDYTPAETAPTGTWTVNLYIVGKDGRGTRHRLHHRVGQGVPARQHEGGCRACRRMSPTAG